MAVAMEYDLAEAYRSLKNNIYYRNLSSNTKILGIWDDHDYGVNDGGNNYKYKHESKELFLKFFNIKKNDKRNYRDGLYKEYTLNYKDKNIQIIILDTRFLNQISNLQIKEMLRVKRDILQIIVKIKLFLAISNGYG